MQAPGPDGVDTDHIVNRVITAIQLPRIAPSQERVPGTRPAGLTGSSGSVPETDQDERSA